MQSDRWFGVVPGEQATHLGQDSGKMTGTGKKVPPPGAEIDTGNN